MAKDMHPGDIVSLREGREPEKEPEGVLSFWRAWALALLFGLACSVAVGAWQLLEGP